MLALKEFKNHKEFMKYFMQKNHEKHELIESINAVVQEIGNIYISDKTELENKEYKDYLWQEFQRSELYDLYCRAYYDSCEALEFYDFLVKDSHTLNKVVDIKFMPKILEYAFQKIKGYQLIEEQENKKLGLIK